MGKLRDKVHLFREETYLCTLPVLSPSAAGAAMMISPKLMFTEEISKLFGRKQKEIEDTKPHGSTESHDIYHDFTVDSNGVETVILYVSDDVDIVLRNFNPAVRIGDLTPYDQMVLVQEGLMDTHFRDENLPKYRPG